MEVLCGYISVNFCSLPLLSRPAVTVLTHLSILLLLQCYDVSALVMHLVGTLGLRWRSWSWSIQRGRALGRNKDAIARALSYLEGN